MLINSSTDSNKMKHDFIPCGCELSFYKNQFYHVSSVDKIFCLAQKSTDFSDYLLLKKSVLRVCLNPQNLSQASLRRLAQCFVTSSPPETGGSTPKGGGGG